MMKKNYTIIDWSSHLPGPYATYKLAKLGLKVIKPINKNKLMPFQKIAQSHLEPLSIFDFWFHSFNKTKEIFYYENESELNDLFQNADGIITNKKELPFETQALITYINSSEKDSYPRHDINAMAEVGLLNQAHLPSLPWAGIELANSIAQNHLKQLLTGEKLTTISLDNSVQELSRALLPEKKQKDYLHTGAFPCYNIYQLKNNSRVALGAVEEKFWINFCEHFKLNFSLEDRFDLSGKIQYELETFFKNLSPTTSMISGETREFCLSLF